jgi:hypothetical protein
MNGHLRFGCLAALLGSFFVQGATAATEGPLGDFKATVSNPSSTAITIDLATLILLPVPDIDHIIIVLGGNAASTDLRGAGWVTTDEPDSGFYHITTLYGIDLDPLGTTLQMTGFDPLQAETFVFHDESFIGQSSTVYPGISLGTPTLAALPALFPGFDLSIFGGDQNSRVYAFQTTVPIADFVPEPRTLVLGAFGILGLGFVARRKKVRLA